jgi:hypothetical protein
MEEIAGGKGRLSDNPQSNPSPYAFADSWTLDASKAAGLGFSFQYLRDYLPGLLRTYASES